jgi:hypothetical protein
MWSWRAQGISPQLRASVKGARTCLTETLGDYSGLDNELRKNGIYQRAVDLRIAIGLVAVVAFVEPFGDQRVRRWPIRTLITRSTDSELQQRMLAFLTLWVQQRKKGLDVQFIAGGYICDTISSWPEASAALVDSCRQVALRAEIGTAVVDAALHCLGKVAADVQN